LNESFLDAILRNRSHFWIFLERVNRKKRNKKEQKNRKKKKPPKKTAKSTNLMAVAGKAKFSNKRATQRQK
jgi:hypothetical protein